MRKLLTQTVRRSLPYLGELQAPKHRRAACTLWLMAGTASSKQRRFNATLVVGVAFANVTLILGKTSGLVYLNWSPPETLH